MATLRAKFRVAWDDKPPVEIKTSARDMLNADQFTDQPAMATFAMIHAALTRLGHAVPPLDEFIDLLDEVEQIGTEVTGIEGPTPAIATAGGPSLLPARPAVTTEPSLPSLTTVPS